MQKNDGPVRTVISWTTAFKALEDQGVGVPLHTTITLS